MEHYVTRVKFNLAGSTFNCSGNFKGKSMSGVNRGHFIRHLLTSGQYKDLSVLIQREPDNQYDPDAMAVVVVDKTGHTNVLVGYVPKAVKEVLPQRIIEELLQAEGTLELPLTVWKDTQSSLLALSATNKATVTGEEIVDILYMVLKTTDPEDENWYNITSDRYCLALYDRSQCRNY